MATESDIQRQIETNAQAAAEVSVDGTTTKEHSLPDQIAADRYVRATKAFRRAGAGLCIQKIIPHGSVR